MGNIRAIERLVYGYAEAVDEGDFAALTPMFAEARFEVTTPGGEVVGAAEGGVGVEDFFRRIVRTYDGRPLVRHVVTNLIVDRDGPRASARATFIVFQGLADFPLQPITGGRYHWDVAKRDGRWAIDRLRIMIEFSGDGSRHNRLGGGG